MAEINELKHNHMDTVSPIKRSQIMSNVRSNRNKSTEWKLRSALVRFGVRGWKVTPIKVKGSPDFVFSNNRLLIFVDGCFWHGCPKCYRRPKSNRLYWDSKVIGNRSRDRRVSRQLRKAGWHVIRFWEHDLKWPQRCVTKITDALKH